ncbi:MAG: PAS domain S-box protein [Candidatus Cloacimonetes bacterium]|nr:PAS domain S-box protein [Candidatus Cloacimonadota bacterium]
MENQIQTFVAISSLFLGFFILITIYLVVKLKLNDIKLKRSEEKLKIFNETLQDIVTERTKKLRESEKQYRSLYELHKEVLENSPAGIIKLNKDLEIEYDNPQMNKIFGFPAEIASQIQGRRITDIPIFQSPEISNFFDDLIKGYEVSRDIPFNDEKRKFFVIMNGVPIFEDQQFSGAVLLINDVTQIKKAHEQIEASLKEKNILLKEVHHRVKNNMQIISSMLKLQLDYIKDKDALELSKNSHNRVKTMALVHEKLYQSENLAKINFADYVRSLTIYLLGYYGLNTKKINLISEIDEVLMDINMAIPCGLILNELVSNSLKHAFTEDRKGEIFISFKTKGDKNILTVSDNGIGLPDSVNLNNPGTLGLQLTKALVQQLHGTIDFHQNEKTIFQITFKNVLLSTYSGLGLSDNGDEF